MSASMATRQSKLSSAARQQVLTPTCGPTAVCALIKDMDDMHFNSTRIAGTDRLDSSDVELSFHVSESFAARIADAVERLRARPELSDATAAVDVALAENVACEVLFFDGGVPTVFVEEVDVATGNMSFRMSSIPPPKLRFAYFESRRYLRVWVERKMPLSSSHGGRRFMLAFVMGEDEVVCTRPFLVFAKKAKEGVGSKFKYQPTFVEVDSQRAAVLTRLQQSFECAGGPAPLAWDAATAPRRANTIVPAHPLCRAQTVGKRGSGPSDGKENAVKLEIVPTEPCAAVGHCADDVKSEGELRAGKRVRVQACDSSGSPASVSTVAFSAVQSDWLSDSGAESDASVVERVTPSGEGASVFGWPTYDEPAPAGTDAGFRDYCDVTCCEDQATTAFACFGSPISRGSSVCSVDDGAQLPDFDDLFP